MNQSLITADKTNNQSLYIPPQDDSDVDDLFGGGDEEEEHKEIPNKGLSYENSGFFKNQPLKPEVKEQAKNEPLPVE